MDLFLWVSSFVLFWLSFGLSCRSRTRCDMNTTKRQDSFNDAVTKNFVSFALGFIINCINGMFVYTYFKSVVFQQDPRSIISYLQDFYHINFNNKSKKTESRMKFVILIWHFCHLKWGIFSFVLSCPVSCRYVLYIHLVINDMIMLTVTVMLQILTYTVPLSFAPCCLMMLIIMTTNK